MSDRLLGVLGNQRLEFALCPLVVEKGTAGAAQQGCKLRPRIRWADVDDADRLDTRTRGLGVNKVGRFARLHASPELLFCRYQDSQIDRVHGYIDLDPFAAPGDDRQYRGP